VSGGQGHQGRKRKEKQRKRQLERKGGNVRNYQQLSLEETSTGYSTEEWGDKLLEKREGVCRVGLLNPSGFTLRRGSAKDDQLRELMKKMEVDIMCLPEVNVCWHKLSPRNRLAERTMGWFETLHRSVAYNYQDKLATRHQYGGTVILSINNAASRVMDSGKDDTGLGRWTWTRFRGRNGIVTRIVCAYRPCAPTGKDKIFSVYAQQQRFFDEQLDDICPREAFIRDLFAAMDTWIEQGEQVIVALDANEELRSGKIATAFHERNMKEVLLQRHGRSAPPTTDNGSAVIDGIWATPSIGIERGGYLAGGEALPRTNHRCLWMDVAYETIYGHTIPPMVRYSIRRLKLQDPRVVNRFNEAYRRWIEQHGLSQRAFNLQSTSKYPLTAQHAEEYEWLDQKKIEGLRHADYRCRKLPMGEVPWSPQLQVLRHRLGYWQLVCKKVAGRNVSTRLIERTRVKGRVERQFLRDVTFGEAREEEKEAYKRYTAFKRNKSREARDTFLDELAEAIAEEGGTKYESVVKSLKTREHMRTTHRRIRWVFNTQQQGAITFVEVQDEYGNLVERATKDEVEQACMDENEQRFRQANNTPFMKSPLVDEFGYLGVGENAQSVLAGTYNPSPGINKYAAMLLAQLKIPEGIRNDPMADFIETEQYIQGWRHVKERTTTGSDFLHFGHFKAGVRDPIIAEFEATMAHIPYATGYSPRRWQHVVDFELLKKEGVFRPETFRTIQMYEPDFNQNNRLLGREAMAHAERHNNLAIEQYGSRKNLSAILHVVNKVLAFDLIRQYKTPAVLCSNDAKSCYDRIIHSVASLCFQHQGVPEAPLVCMLSTLQNMTHTIRTAYGDSTRSYGGRSWATPIQGLAWGDMDVGPMSGMGQGNGAAPASWAVISSPILEIMRKRGQCTDFKAFISGEELKIVGFAFVDDKDLLRASSVGRKTGGEVTQEMQQGLDLWEGLLKATGGALVPEKSYWYLIDFKWKDGGWKYATTEETQFELTMKDKDDVRHILSRLPVNEARRSLGYRAAPDGNRKAQVEYMRSVAVEWRDRLRAGHLTRYEAWTALSTRVMKTLLYAAPAATITNGEASHIMAPIVMSGLNAMGMQRHMPRAVVYAPLKFQGMAVPNLYIETGIQHIAILLRETSGNSPTGKLLRMSIEATKVEIGVGGSLFTQSFDRFGPLATECWVKHTWKFLAEHGMTIEDRVGELKLRRQGDIFLTEVFLQQGLKGAVLKRMNACRLYLRADTLADITTADGRYISSWALEGKSEANPITYHEWPNQGDPGRHAWTQWRQMLASWFCAGHLEHGLLNTLGAWLEKAPKEWQWWYVLQEERVYRILDGNWQFYSVWRTGQRTRQRRFIYGGTIENEEVPRRRRRATVREYGENMVQLTGYSENETIRDEEEQSVPLTLAQRIQACPDNIRWAVERFAVEDGGRTIAEAIRQRKAVAVSDGSYKDEFGTAAYVLEGANSENRLVGVLVSPGRPEDQQSSRSELAGLYGVVVMVNLVCKQFDIKDGVIEVGCDSQSSLRNVFGQGASFEAEIKDTDYDLRSAIRKQLEQSTIQWKGRHVAGHQDDDDGIEELDRWATLNIEMDSLAKIFWNDMCENQAENITIAGEYWPVYIEGEKIASKLDERIRDHVLGQAQCDRWERKGRLTRESITRVNWQACGKAMKSLTIGRRLWIAKHVSGHAGVGTKMVQWQLRESAACPRCGAEEDCRHVWTCHSPDARLLRLQHIVKLDEWLRDQETQPDVRRELINGIKAWSVDTERRTFYQTPTHIREVLTHQDHIGWTNLLEGCIDVGWTEAQALYYKTIGSRRSGLRWTVAVIKKLWDVAWDLWEQRNGFLHDAEYRATLHNTASLDSEIRFQFRQGAVHLPRRTHYLFECSLSELLTTSVRHRQQWLKSVVSARAMAKECQMLQDKSLAASRQLMRAWLNGTQVGGG
jgi:hypothetical protein